jgi:SAM-dependent methyltransferase
VSSSDHNEAVRQSFRQQVGLFSGPDSPFARRDGALGWLEPLAPEMVALEVACGAAHAAETVAPSVRQVVGVDLTRELLELGADRLREGGIDNVLLQEGDAEQLPFVDRSFDLVFCRSSLHHFADPQRAVEEMIRVSRHDGRVVLLDLIAPSAEERDRFDHLHRLLDPSHVRVFLEDELAGVFPASVELAHGETNTLRLPIDIALTEQSDRGAVLEMLREELAGGASTGFDPVEEDGTVVVSFTHCTVHGRIAT